jgi:hypothetical protein
MSTIIVDFYGSGSRSCDEPSHSDVDADAELDTLLSMFTTNNFLQTAQIPRQPRVAGDDIMDGLPPPSRYVRRNSKGLYG